MNPGTAVIVNLLGGVALLLWGVRMVRTGVMRAYGDRLKNFIEHRVGNRLSAFTAGGVATAILGSGTAMTLIVAGLAAAGAINTALGLAVLLGADVGSAIVSAVFASGSTLALWASPLLIFAGYVVHSWSAELRPHNMGRFLIGLGLMLLSLTLIKQASAPLSEATLFHQVLAAVGREPFLAFVIGAVLTWMFHSSLAVILLIASFLASGSLGVEGALAFILGINLGGGLPAVSATLAQPPVARRLPLANLLCRGVVAILALAFIGRIAPFVHMLPLGPVESAVAFHAGFNIAVGLLFLPLTPLMAKLMERILPEAPGDTDSLARPRYLDPRAAKTPAVALANVLLETVRMTELLERMFDTALDALRSGSTEKLKQLRPMDERLNTYQTQLQAYLGDLAQEQLSPEESRRALELTLYISNLEHAGDVIQLNLADRIEAKTREQIAFTLDEIASLDNLCTIIHDNLKLASAVLSSGDVEGAKRLISQKDAFRELQTQVLDKHFQIGSRGKGEALRRSALYVDMIRDLNRLNSLVVSAGYPIADAAGLLRGSRLRQDNPMKLIHITDLHLMPLGETLWGLDPMARFDAALNDIAAHHGDADLCVITGDLTEKGDVAAYEALRERLKRFPLETHLLLGNHDDRANYLKVFGGADVHGHVQHAILRDGCHLLFLDTLKGPPSSAGLYDALRRHWLKAELERIDGAPAYLFMHHPPFDIGHALMDLIKLDDAEEFAALLKGHDIRHIFFGHAHRTISGSWSGIGFSALPSLNHQLPLVGGSVETVYSDEPPMYAAVTLSPQMTVVHSDAFLHRRPAQMRTDAERGNWY